MNLPPSPYGEDCTFAFIILIRSTNISGIKTIGNASNIYSPHRDVKNKITLIPVPIRIIEPAADSHLFLLLFVTISKLVEANIRMLIASAIIVNIVLIVLLQS